MLVLALKMTYWSGSTDPTLYEFLHFLCPVSQSSVQASTFKHHNLAALSQGSQAERYQEMARS